MTKDMTAGKPLGLILRFCGPMVFGNILQQLYSMVDTVIVGRYLGASALAGVGATGAISFLVVGFATGICTGLSIPVAQAFGAGDYHSMRKNIANSYYLGALIGVLLTMAVCCMVAMIAISYLEPVLDFLRELETLGDLQGDMLGILLKAVGIGLVSEIAGLVCTDAGNGSLGKTLQMLGSAVILYLSLPIFTAMLELIREILREL